MRTGLHPLLATTLVVCAASAAQAQETTEYTLRGTHAPMGAYTATLNLEDRGNGRYAVTVVTRFASSDLAARGELLQKGDGLRDGDTITIAPLQTIRGIRGVLENIGAADTTLTVRLLGDGREVVVSGTDAAGTSSASGLRVGDASPDADDEGDEAHGAREKLQQKGKHLVALAKEALQEASYDGVTLNTTFKLSDYFHLGVGGGLRVIDPEAWSPAQRLSASGLERPIWLGSKISGGVKVPLDTTIPMGDVTLELGFQAGAKVDYEVVDLYDKPEGVTDTDTILADLRSMRKRTFDLPLSAEEAQAMTVGGQAIFDGQGTVAVSGHFRVGHDVSDMGDVVRIGASARVGGFYRVRGDVRAEVTRLMHNAVRLRVTRGKTTTREANADLLLGATVDERALEDELGSSVEFISPGVLREAVVGVVADEIEDVLRFQIKARKTHEIEDELDLSYRFDLGEAAARAAYDKAIRGDLTHADAVSAQQGSGVTREFRVFDLEERTYLGADLDVSVLLKAGASRRVSMNEVVVEDAVNGNTSFDIFRFEREREFSLFGGREIPFIRTREDRERNVTVELIRETDAAGVVRRSFRYEFSVKDPHTTRPDAERFSRVLEGLGLDPGTLPDRDFRLFRSRYGKTRSSITVEIGEAGLVAILRATPERAMRAYVEAFTALKGEVPEWATPAGRARIRRNRHSNHGSVANRSADRRLWSELRRANTFVENLNAINPNADADDRAEALEKLSKSAGYQLYTVVALVNLAPRESVSAKANVAGKRIAVNASVTGSAYAPVTVHDPR